VIGAVVLVMFFIAVSALWDIRAALRGIYRILWNDTEEARKNAPLVKPPHVPW
jgi:hypothetical protein